MSFRAAKTARSLGGGVIVIALAATLSLSAQPRAGSESINVTLVEVPVNVTRGGDPVRGLTAENFRVVDAGQKRAITHFEVVDYAAPALARGEEVPAPSARRRFMLLFDLNHTTPASLEHAREAATSFVEHQTLPSDLIAVATISMQSGAHLRTSFTTDRAFVLDAIRTLGMQKMFSTRDVLLLTASDFESVAANATGRWAGYVADHYDGLAANMKMRADDEKKELIHRELDQYAELGRLLDRVKGRKQVVLLSEGFDAKMLHGREEVPGDAAAKLGRVASIEQSDPDSRYGNTEAGNALKKMIDAMRRSDVVLHAIDIKGLRSNVDASDGLRTVSNESLSLLTHDTGGTVFKNSNSLESDFGRMMKAQEVTYVLAFEVPTRSPGKFHELNVSLVNVPNARITHRPGYYEPSNDSTAIARALTAGEIVMNRIAADDIGVKTLATAFPAADGKADVPVIAEISGRSLVADLAAKSASVEIFVYAFDRKETIRDFLYQRATFDLDKVRDRLAARGVKFYATLRLPPGDYSIRTLVRGGDGRNGFREAAAHVPGAQEPFAFPPLIFDDPAGWVMVKAERPDAGPYPFTAGERTFLPSALPVMSPGVTSELALIAYNLPSTFDLRATLSGNPVELKLIGRTAPEADGRVTYLLDARPPKMERGEYMLVMNLQEKGRPPRTLSIPVQIQ